MQSKRFEVIHSLQVAKTGDNVGLATETPCGVLYLVSQKEIEQRQRTSRLVNTTSSMVERLPFKRKVVGSTPTSISKNGKSLPCCSLKKVA